MKSWLTLLLDSDRLQMGLSWCHAAKHSYIGHIFIMQNHQHTYISTCTPIYAQREKDIQEEELCNPGTSSLPGSRCWYKQSFLYRYISTDSLSSQASSSLATIHRTSSAALVKPHSLASCLCFSTAAPAYSNQLQPILIPGKKTRTGGMGDVKWHG